MTSPVSGDGRGVALGRVSKEFIYVKSTENILLQIYTRKGILVAVLSQEGLIRVDTRNVQQQESQDAKL